MSMKNVNKEDMHKCTLVYSIKFLGDIFLWM